MTDEKLTILKTLLVDEEYTLEDLRRLVKKSRPFLKIENKSGNIIISPEHPLTVSEKIIIYLIGIFFSKELGFYQDVQITSRFISENIDVAQTTISGPLGNYVKTKILGKDDNSYSIKYYEIERQLDFLTEKYNIKEDKNIPISSKKIINIKTNKAAIKKITSQPEFQEDIRISKEDIVDEIAKHDLTLEDLYSVVNIDDDRIVLLRGWKGTSTLESQVKASLLFLTTNKLIHGLNEINSSEFRVCLSNTGVPIKNLSTNLKNYYEYIIHKKGPIGSTKTSYRITSIGFQKGLLLLKDIIFNTLNFDLKFKTRIRTETTDKILVDEKELNRNINSFARDNGLDEERLRSLFEFQTNDIRICSPIIEKTRKTMQLKTLMLLGIILKKVYGVNNFSAKILLKSSRTTYDRLDLLNSNKHYIKYFSANRPKSAMQLTFAGEKRAIEMLKSYLTNEQCEL